jgi:ethanolamine utilization protein EutN
VGTVLATKKDERLVGAKLLIVKQLGLDLEEKEDFVIAIDNVGAGSGDIVLVANGSSARQAEFTENKPVDSVVMAIVDKLDVSQKNI